MKIVKGNKAFLAATLQRPEVREVTITSEMITATGLPKAMRMVQVRDSDSVTHSVEFTDLFPTYGKAHIASISRLHGRVIAYQELINKYDVLLVQATDLRDQLLSQENSDD